MLGQSSAHNIRSTAAFGTSEATAKGSGTVSFDVRDKTTAGQENYDSQMSLMRNNMKSIKIQHNELT